MNTPRNGSGHATTNGIEGRSRRERTRDHDGKRTAGIEGKARSAAAALPNATTYPRARTRTHTRTHARARTHAHARTRARPARTRTGAEWPAERSRPYSGMVAPDRCNRRSPLRSALGTTKEKEAGEAGSVSGSARTSPPGVTVRDMSAYSPAEERSLHAVAILATEHLTGLQLLAYATAQLGNDERPQLVDAAQYLEVVGDRLASAVALLFTELGEATDPDPELFAADTDRPAPSVRVIPAGAPDDGAPDPSIVQAPDPAPADPPATR